jgi:hypothetical protein
MKAINLEKMLPADIPPGEKILWFGRPEPVSFWRRAYRADWVAGYFMLLAAWNCASSAIDSGAVAATIVTFKTLGLGAAALALLAILAWLGARTTLYVITSRRLVMKVGIALPIFYNVPFTQIGSAAFRGYSDGTGDIPVALVGGQRIAYLTLWPHAKPFRFKKPEPALRCVENAREIAAILAQALSAASGEAHKVPEPAKPALSDPAYAATAAA